jgi:hypothetical protein
VNAPAEEVTYASFWPSALFHVHASSSSGTWRPAKGIASPQVPRHQEGGASHSLPSRATGPARSTQMSRRRDDLIRLGDLPRYSHRSNVDCHPCPPPLLPTAPAQADQPVEVTGSRCAEPKTAVLRRCSDAIPAVRHQPLPQAHPMRVGAPSRIAAGGRLTIALGSRSRSSLTWCSRTGRRRTPE